MEGQEERDELQEPLCLQEPLLSEVLVESEVLVLQPTEEDLSAV